MKVDREKLRFHAICNTVAGAPSDKRRAAQYMSWTAYGPDDAAAREKLAVVIEEDIRYARRYIAAETA